MAEASQDWVRAPERGSGFWLRVMRVTGRYAPEIVTAPLIWLISLYFTLVPGRTTSEGQSAYFRALHGRAPRFSERHAQLRCFSHVVLDRVRLLARGTDRFRISATGEDLVQRLHADGRGAVLLGAHFGSFEALRAFDRTLPGLTVRYMMHEDHAEKSAALLRELNADLAERVIPLRDGIQAMMEARAALEAGEFVAFLGDRMPEPNPRAEITARFLGAPIRLPRAPYLAAMLANVPILLCFAPRTARRRYDIAFTELYDGSPILRGNRDAACAAMAQGYSDALADMCRRHPDNWFNFFDIWR